MNKHGVLSRLCAGLLIFVLMTTGFQMTIYAIPMNENFDTEFVGDKGTQSYTINGITYTTNDTGVQNIEIVNNGDIASLGDLALGYRSSGPNNTTQVSFRTSDGIEFKLNSFVISTGLGDTIVTIKGYRDNAEIASSSVNTESFVTFDVAANDNWNNIDEVRMTGADLDIDIDDLNFSPAVLPTYDVTYNGNGNTGGSLPADATSYHNGDTVTVLGNTGSLVRSGYTFAGWNTAANGSGTSYVGGDTFAMGNSNVTLYAQWTAINYSVTYNGNTNTGGSVPTDGNSYNITNTVTVLGNTGTLVKTGYSFTGWNTAANGSRTSYSVGNTFAMGSSDVTLYAQWTIVNNDSGTTIVTPTQQDPPNVANIQINEFTQPIATSDIVTKAGIVVTTITVDNDALNNSLKVLDNNSVVTIPVLNNSDRIIGLLNGQTIKNMESREAVLEIKTETVTYTLPAAQIDIDKVSNLIGKQIELEDIIVNLAITTSSQETVKIVQDTANKNNYQVIIKPVEFEITCTNGTKSIEVSKFNGFVERTIAIPENVDPSKITTGIVLNADGTFTHVPTSIIVIEGKYYARINSMTNSVYSVIYSPQNYADLLNHWGEEVIVDMGSRLIMSGAGEDRFEPEEEMTRAEFVNVVIKALGLLRMGSGQDIFSDVKTSNEYYDAITIASDYGLITGYGNGIFKPGDSITREQAMVIIGRAMKLTNIAPKLMEEDILATLAKYSDFGVISEYAKNEVAACVSLEIIDGGNAKQISPSNKITRAEVATIVKRLLIKSRLID